MAVVKRLPVHHNSADYIFWSFGIIEFFYSYLENRVLLKPVLEGVASVVHFITGHEQPQLNGVCYFHFFGVLLASKESNCSELIYIIYIMSQETQKSKQQLVCS